MNSASSCRYDSRADTFTQQITLKLSKSSHDRSNQLPLRGGEIELQPL
jgi:hypothetical protein